MKESLYVKTFLLKVVKLLHNSFDYFYCIWKASGGSVTTSYLRKNNLFVWGVLGFGKNTTDGELRIAVWSTAFLFFRQIFLSVKKNSSFLDFTSVIPEGFSFFRKPLPTDAHASWTGWGWGVLSLLLKRMWIFRSCLCCSNSYTVHINL